VGYKFTLVLSRELSDDESAVLVKEGCDSAVFGADTLPTNAEVPVTKMEFDNTTSPNLAEAIESALEAVKRVPDLSVPGLTVPAQPAGPIDDTDSEPGVVAGEKPEIVSEERIGDGDAQPAAAEAEPAAKKPARKPAAKKASASKG
jgi:hypothetical protein